LKNSVLSSTNSQEQIEVGFVRTSYRIFFSSESFFIHLLLIECWHSFKADNTVCKLSNLMAATSSFVSISKKGGFSSELILLSLFVHAHGKIKHWTWK